MALALVGAVFMFAGSGGAAAASSPSPTGATITSNQADYPPGSNVTLTGAGWGIGESVQIHVNDDANQVWQYDGSAFAGLDGSFTHGFQLPNVFVANYSVTATGTTSGTATTTFTDANASANLDQCDPPDPYDPLTYTCAKSGATGWVNGNNDGIYFEGDSLPYRLTMENLSLASHTVTIEWDTTKGGTHALDYITSFDRTMKAANPCAGVSGCSGSPNTFAIPADPQVTGAGVTPVAGSFSLYGGTITAVSNYSYPDGTGFSGDKSARITITFTASVANPVLAWAGHIASRQDWGANNSAVAISGSPYHTRLKDLDLTGGNQDRSLSADAVIFPGSIEVIKDAAPDSSQSFSFTGSPSPLTNFSLVDDGTNTNNSKLFSNITTFQTYTVNETPIPSGWSFDSSSCSASSPNGGSYTTSGTPPTTTAINMAEGENWTCTYVNKKNATLTIKKVTDPVDSGSSTFGFTASGSGTSAFTLDTNTSDSTNSDTKVFTFSGSQLGSKSVTEGSTSGWSLTDITCVGATNSGTSPTATVNVTAGADITCTYTNKKDAKLTIKKVTDPANSGSDSFPYTSASSGVDASFSLDTNAADATNPSQKTFTFTSSQLGSKSVTEGSTSGWTLTNVTCVGGTNTGTGSTATVNVAAGADITCTYTNKKDAKLTIKKVTDPANSGSDSFPYTSASSGVDASFSLDTNAADATNPSQKSFTFSGTGYGSKSVTEGTTSGWTLTNVDCGSASNSGSGATATVTVNPGDDITCTYTNKKDAKLTIKKVTDPANSGSDSFPYTSASSGVDASFSLDTNAADATNPSQKSFTFSGTGYGSKSVTEGTTSGWTLTNVDCGSASNSGSGATATVTVNPGDDITCTYTNKKDAKLTIKKVTDPANSGSDSFPYTSASSGVDASFSLDTNAADATNPSQKTFTFTSSQLGSKSVTEGSTSGWTLTNVTCVGGTNTGTGSTATVNVAAGADITCTYTNKKDAKLTIKKVTDPANSGSDSFPYTSASSGVDASFSLDTNAADATNPSQKSFTFSGTGYGSKSVTEGTTSGWTLTNVDCGSASNSGSGATATVTVNPGDDITCTYTNKKLPKLTVIKHVVNDNGGNAVASAWSIHVKSGSSEVGGSPQSGSESGTTYTLTPGTFTASETGGPSAYTFDGFSGQCSSTGSVTLAYGDDKTCTLTNNDQPGKIVIIKNAKPAEGTFTFTTTGSTSGQGTSWPGQFTLTGATTNNGNTRTFTLDAGSYSVTEGTQLSWVLTGIGGSTDPSTPYNCVVSGSGGSTGVGDLNTQAVSISLKIGDTVTCTFENTGNGATRTQGFWATHQRLARIAWFGGSGYGHIFPGVAGVTGIGDMTFCTPVTKDLSGTVATPDPGIGRLMGGFWSDISKTSTAKKRSSTDQGRMQLVQQLLAAELNASAFGSIPAGGSAKFAAWEAAYCSGNGLQNAQKEAASFNSQGDNSTFTPGTAADSKNARAIALIPYWDTLP